jgi:hypothetical protein
MIPTTTNTFTRHEQGYDVFILQNEHLEIALVPELGAKIISLLNRRTGREWMWQPARGLKLFQNQLGDDFAKSTMIGWDECLPTIAPCLHRGRKLPDHGEVWSVPWQLDRAAWQLGKLKTSVSLALSPFDFARTIELCGNSIHLHYELINRNNEPEEFIWAMHPLVPVFPDDSLELTTETRELLGNPSWIRSLDLAGSQAACVKTYAGPLREGQAAVVNVVSGDRMIFSWDTQLNNTLGVWLTRGGWNGYHHLALEPSNGCPDVLAAASANHRCGVIPARGKISWQVAIQIDPVQLNQKEFYESLHSKLFHKNWLFSFRRIAAGHGFDGLHNATWTGVRHSLTTNLSRWRFARTRQMLAG